MFEICSDLKIMTPERFEDVTLFIFIVNFEQISRIILEFPLLPLNKWMPPGYLTLWKLSVSGKMKQMKHCNKGILIAFEVNKDDQKLICLEAPKMMSSIFWNSRAISFYCEKQWELRQNFKICNNFTKETSGGCKHHTSLYCSLHLIKWRKTQPKVILPGFCLTIYLPFCYRLWTAIFKFLKFVWKNLAKNMHFFCFDCCMHTLFVNI